MSAGQSTPMGRGTEPGTTGRASRSMQDQNKSVVRRAMEEIWGKGNMSALNELYAPIFVDHTPQQGTTPNREGVKQAYNLYHKAFPDFDFTIDSVIAEGDEVCARITFRGTQQGEIAGIPPTGKRVNLTGVEICRVKDGKITESWEFLDQTAMMQQLGMLPKTH